ncbi:MAG: NAD-dependent epimerase/dehydratase family protein, partial [Bryobacterales bacterium]|nr:NAD-dependent epimerase/dehydratase family protein [Bryobacterales bacterium]
MKVLVTGGAGFIGAHVANELLKHRHSVRVLDSLIPQVHGPERKRPAYLHRDVELIVKDIRDSEAVNKALDQIDAVVHLVSLVGVGQSMYQMAEYTSVNNLGTATLLQALTSRPVNSLVVASSMSIYGEGAYRDGSGNRVDPPNRTLEQLKMGSWELMHKGEPLIPLPTPESKRPALASVYALSKYDQERMALIVGEAYRFAVVALRFFNTYGPYQAL